jgi:hypothetical protein
MAEIIDFAEIQEARRKARARIPERENLERMLGDPSDARLDGPFSIRSR